MERGKRNADSFFPICTIILQPSTFHDIFLQVSVCKILSRGKAHSPLEDETTKNFTVYHEVIVKNAKSCYIEYVPFVP